MDIVGNVEFLTQIKQHILEFESKKTQQRDMQKVNGSVYTPFRITNFISNNLLTFYLKQCLPPKKRSEFTDASDILEAVDQILSKYPELKEDLALRFSKIKVLDPACGTGRFLLSFADLFCKFLKILHPEKSIPSLKVQIMRNNLYGIELDEEAHFISLLRMYHWIESSKTRNESGNTKIHNGVNFTNNRIKHLISQSLENRICRSEFLLKYNPKFKFDLILGNPPYIQNRTIRPKSYKTELYKRYKSAYKLFDISILFIEKSLDLLRNEYGLLSFILPNKFLSANYGLKIRKLIFQGTKIKQLYPLSSLPIFPGTATYPIILMLNKSSDTLMNRILIRNYGDVKDFKSNGFISQSYYSQSEISKYPNYVIPIKGNIKLVSYLYENYQKFSDSFINLEIQYRPYGFLNWANHFKSLSNKKKTEKDLILLGTGNIGKYHIKFEKTSKIAKFAFLPSYFHINENHKPALMNEEKLLFREIAKHLTCVYDPGLFTNITGLYSIRIPSFTTEDYFSLLAILNSKFIDLVFNTLFSTLHMSGGYKRYNGSFIKTLPIPNYFPPSIAKLAKIVQFLSQLKYESNQNPYSFKSLRNISYISEYISFFSELIEIFIKKLYCEDLIKDQNQSLLLIADLLNYEPQIDEFEFKYPISRFDLPKYKSYSPADLAINLNWIASIYAKLKTIKATCE